MHLMALCNALGFRRRVLTKTFRIMKMTAIILFAACMQVSAKGYSQQVTLSLKNVSLKVVFFELNKQTGYNFLYSDEVIAGAAPVTVDVKNAAIEDVLNQCFQGQPLAYSIVNNTIVIKSKPVKPAPLNTGSASPPTEIHGRVADEGGKPLAGATVAVKNTRISAVTDAEGGFKLNVSAGEVLVISYVGFSSQEYKISPSFVASSDRQVKITLSASDNSLDQIQVIAYGQTTQRLNVGDVTTIKAEDIEKQPEANVLTSLEGRVPGLLITQRNGLPGASFTVQIRGQNSIQEGSDPFYVIDGVPYTSELLTGTSQNPSFGNPLDFINPSDIESISVLKDADATAIYGSRAANGAILITTKKGEGGEIKIGDECLAGDRK